jgi:hypothetical protein
MSYNVYHTRPLHPSQKTRQLWGGGVTLSSKVIAGSPLKLCILKYCVQKWELLTITQVLLMRVTHHWSEGLMILEKQVYHSNLLSRPPFVPGSRRLRNVLRRFSQPSAVDRALSSCWLEVETSIAPRSLDTTHALCACFVPSVSADIGTHTSQSSFGDQSYHLYRTTRFCSPVQ